MSRNYQRASYFHACGRHGVPLSVAESILRIGSTLQRAAEVDCCCNVEAVRTAWAKRAENARKRLQRVSKGSAPSVRFSIHGDPRGAVLRILTDSAPDGIAVPGIGFTGAQLERMS